MTNAVTKRWRAKTRQTQNARHIGRALRNFLVETKAYAGTVSGNTASILVFRVAALNGLTM